MPEDPEAKPARDGPRARTERDVTAVLKAGDVDSSQPAVRGLRPMPRPRTTGAGRTLAERMGMPALKTPVALLSLPGERMFDARGAQREGRHLVGELVGEGGMGKVFAARDVELGRTVALKTLADSRREDEGFVQALVFEARLTGQLEHPNIIPVHDVGVLDDGTPFYTMTLVGDTSLRDLLLSLRDDPAAAATSLNRLLHILRSVCMAVSYAHARGVIHRDLKPDNVLLGEYGEVHILDWGVARVLPHDGRPAYFAGRPEEPGAIIGTPHYMSPEQARGDTHLVDARSDVFSIGVILYQILTLTLPFDATTTREQLDALLTEPAPAPSLRAPGRDIPPELERICQRAMAPRRADRYPSVRALWDDVERFLEGKKEAERLARLAQAHVKVAGAAVARYQQLSRSQQVLEERVREDTRASAPLDPIASKRAEWQRSLDAQRGKLLEARAFAEAVDGFQRALAHVPDDDAIRGRLADLYRSRSLLARRRGDEVGYVLYADLDRATRAAPVATTSGLLHVRSEPGGAQLRLIDLDAPTAAPGDAEPLGLSPIAGCALRAGSYLIEAELPGYRAARLPVVIRAGEVEHVLIVLTRWDLAAPMLSRAQELATISAAFEAAARDGRTHSVLVTGAVGLGKRQLLSDFGRYLDELPELVAYGVVACTESGAHVPLQAASDFVAHRAGISLRDDTSAILRKITRAVRGAIDHDGALTLDAAAEARVHTIAAHLSGLPAFTDHRSSIPSPAPRARTLAVFDALAAYIQALGERMPVALAIRGAEHLDRLSRDMLRYFMSQASGTPLFCLMLAADNRLGLRADYELPLRPLDAERTARQIALLLRGRVDPALVAFIDVSSAGNTSHIIALTQLLVGRGWIVRRGEPRCWRWSPEAEARTDKRFTLHDLLSETVDRLPLGARRVLEVAAVSGPVAWSEQIHAALGRDVSEDLAALAADDVLVPVPESRFRGTQELAFRDEALRTMLCAQLSEEALRALRIALADWLAARPDRRLSDVALAAAQYRKAGAAERAATHHEALCAVARGWEGEADPAWFAWPEDLRSVVLD